MRRKEGLEKEEKRKENFPLLLESNTRREDLNHQNLMNKQYVRVWQRERVCFYIHKV